DQTNDDHFRVIATAMAREDGGRQASGLARLTSSSDLDFGLPDLCASHFSMTGSFSIAEGLARFIRPGLVEEYSVKRDGIRQDFQILERPSGEGQLRLKLEVSGAKAEPSEDGIRLVLDCSGRKISYSQLRVTDARGNKLPARFETCSSHSL